MTLEELGIINDMPRGWIKHCKWHEVVYYMWRDMHRRCKDSTSSKYQYYSQSKIEAKFDFLSNYVAFIEAQPLFESFKETCHEIKWCVDKDIKKKGNKHYYSEYMFLTLDSINLDDRNMRKGLPWHTEESKKKSAQSRKKPIIAIPLKIGSIILLKSVNDANEKGFSAKHIPSVLKGKKNSLNGYKWKYVNYKHNKRYRKVVK